MKAETSLLWVSTILEDNIIISASFIIAVVGVCWNQPPLLAKIALVGCAFVIAFFRFEKVSTDADEKRWMRTVVSSNLRASPETLKNLEAQVVKSLSKKGYNTYTYYYSNEIGVEFLFFKGDREEALVFNSWDLGNIIRDASSE